MTPDDEVKWCFHLMVTKGDCMSYIKYQQVTRAHQLLQSTYAMMARYIGGMQSDSRRYPAS